MFGYIAPVLTALSEDQKQRYRSVYCGVCHALKDLHGQPGRVSLSNDMAFLALLLSSLYEPEDSEGRSRCALHPLKAHRFRSSSLIRYAADMNVLLFHYKCVDQRKDDRSAAGRAGEVLFRRRAEEVRGRWPLQAEQVEKALDSLWKEEESPSPSVDRLCNLSGEMLGAVFVPYPEDPWSPVLRSVGESLGRFIYWMDAWEDYDEDARRSRFNPLVPYRSRPDYEDFCRETLELLIAEAANGFEILPLERDLDLLRNVLYGGVWQKYTLITERRLRKEDAHAKRSL